MIIIAIICNVLSHIFDQQLKVTFRKDSALPPKKSSPSFLLTPR